jgi:hypothetical protein
MQPHIIEIERIDGGGLLGVEIIVNVAANVRADTEAPQGWYQSSLRMSESSAKQLHSLLTQALAAIAADAPQR